MSTPIRDLSYHPADIPYGKRIVVDKEHPKEILADYVRRLRLEKGLSLADVSLRSSGRIGKTHINRIENGLVTNPGVEALRALAKGLGVPEEEIFAVARGKKLEEDEALPSHLQMIMFKFNNLPLSKQVEMEKLLEVLDREIDRLNQK
jgi:transcriptional regulator with XRE-family HTH domain